MGPFSVNVKESKGVNIGLLRQIMGNRARPIVDGLWEKPGADVVQEAAVTK